MSSVSNSFEVCELQDDDIQNVSHYFRDKVAVGGFTCSTCSPCGKLCVGAFCAQVASRLLNSFFFVFHSSTTRSHLW